MRKQGSSGEEVPDVMVVKEIQQDALPRVLPGTRWRSLEEVRQDVGE